MLKRGLEPWLVNLFKKYPAIAILGPRQSGKTTLAKETFPHLKYMNLEDLTTRQYATENPKGMLNAYPEGLIIGEIQNVPDLMSYLQVYIDEKDRPGLYVITGSQQILLNKKISQSLAGRVGINTLLPLSYQELQQQQNYSNVNELIFNGFYPRLFQYNMTPKEIYPSYIQTYIERDVRQMINISDDLLFYKFLKACALRVGQVLNLSSLAYDCGISHVTAKKWLSLLEMSFIVYLLRPHHSNFNKRLIKSPKLYFYDTGVACNLLGIARHEELGSHFAKGALFENFIVIEYLKKQYNEGNIPNCYFWRDKLGHEIDFIVERGTKLFPVEIKSGANINTDYFKNLRYFNTISDTKHHNYLVYDGPAESRTDTKMLNWQHMGALWDDIENLY